MPKWSERILQNFWLTADQKDDVLEKAGELSLRLQNVFEDDVHLMVYGSISLMKTAREKKNSIEARGWLITEAGVFDA